MDLGINGKIALVTAASRGLGRGCAQQLAAEKCRVAICSRDEAAAQQAAEEIVERTDAEVVGFGSDVSRTEDVERLLKDFTQSLGNPEILVTNAGGPLAVQYGPGRPDGLFENRFNRTGTVWDHRQRPAPRDSQNIANRSAGLGYGCPGE